MKTLLAATAAINLTGAALAAQSHQGHAAHGPNAAWHETAIDPNVILRPPAGWTEPQLVLYREHMVYLPERWTAEQRANYREQLGIPPVEWTPEQRMLYHEHMATLPPGWTAEQRAAYERQVAEMHEPWRPQAIGTGPANDPVDTQGAGILRDNQRGRDMDAPLTEEPQARPAPATRNQPRSRARRAAADSSVPDMRRWAGMGGPYEEVYGDGVVSLQARPADKTYPPCSPKPSDDNCVQLYERGVRR